MMKGATSSRFDGVDRSMTSAYTMQVDINGNLGVVAGGGEIENNDKRDDANAFAEFFTDINDYSSWLTKFVPEFAATQFSTFPISFVKDFRSPGSKVFGFKEVQFSDFQYFTASITYAQAWRNDYASSRALDSTVKAFCISYLEYLLPTNSCCNLTVYY